MVCYISLNGVSRIRHALNYGHALTHTFTPTFPTLNYEAKGVVVVGVDQS